MEWVVTTGKTVEEAQDAALDQLGVDLDDAEFEVLEEPRPGLFGRMRGEAKVRARVRPTTPRPKVERRDRRRKSGAGDSGNGDAAAETADAAVTTVDAAAAAPGQEADADVTATPTPASARRSRGGSSNRTNGPARTAPAARPTQEDPMSDTPEEEGARAAAFLEGLAQAFGLEATTSVTVDEDDVEVRLDGADLGLLIGPRGQTLVAVQDLVRTASNRAGANRTTSLRIDIGGYREARRQALSRFTQQVAEDVIRTGTAKILEPMSAADRKVVHDTATGIDGVTTSSEGEDPNRYVVIRPDAS